VSDGPVGSDAAEDGAAWDPSWYSFGICGIMPDVLGAHCLDVSVGSCSCTRVAGSVGAVAILGSVASRTWTDTGAGAGWTLDSSTGLWNGIIEALLCAQ